MPLGKTSDRTCSNLIEAFAEAVAEHSDKTAMRCGSESLTYSELDLQSDALADQLRSMSIETGDRVGVCGERRAELAVAILGIIKAGASYIPLDDSYPRERLEHIRDDADIKILLGQSTKLNCNSVENLTFDQFTSSGKFESDQSLPGETAAYMMYTSGTTGKPKGVTVPHRAILRLVIDQNYCDLGPDETILQHSPLAFDASTFEIWGALLNGGCLVIHSSEDTSLRIIGDAIRDYGITTLWLTAGLFHAIADERPEDLKPLRQLLTGGDIVSPAHSAKILELAPDLRLINGYGPTENTTFTCCHTITYDEVKDGNPIPIGKPISGTDVHILDPELNPVESGESGELCASGPGLALGYHNNPELTAEKFVNLDDGTRVYRTGDLAKSRPEGAIEFLGRIDQQVKIRGFRIELGEIENAILDIEDIQQVCVVAEKTSDGADKVLIAHYVAEKEISRESFRNELEEHLPDYSIPAFYNCVDELPLNTNGKVDRRALPGLKQIMQLNSAETPELKTESSISIVTAAFAEVLELPSIPSSVNFFDLGASSLQIARIHERIQNALNIEFPVTDFFHHTTVKALSDHIDRKNATGSEQASNDRKNSSESLIAIVGMAGRFPGAPDVDTFWQNLVDGKETISHFTAEELDFENASTDPEAEGTYIKSRGIIDDSDYFDATHFGIPPREAIEMDPQHRIMLECAQTALENAGHDPDRFNGKIGLFCGASQNSWLLSKLCLNPDYAKKLAAGYPTNNFNAVLGNDKDFLPTRVAYKLNLKGPAVSVQCACSTSLVSVAQACESLRTNTCDMALAGGISLGFPQKRDYLYTPDGIASKDGHCRTFDADATGTVFGEGAGLVALRRLEDAVADGDNIIAVIRGYAINNDGSDKAGYTAPSIKGQVEVIREAQKAAGVNAESIGYIEAHGTATPLGDPIEIAALDSAFRETTDKKQYCYIGTGKTNVGHLDIAAGITGLIKTALTVQKGVIPPLLHYRKPNPKIDFENSPFIPVSEKQEWDNEKGARRAGVSAFGVGGTNVHVILEENQKCTRYTPESYQVQSSLFPLSASNPEALQEAISALGHFAKDHPDADIDSVAATLQHGRRNFQHRTILVADSLSDLSGNALDFEGRCIKAGNFEKTVFLFPGQGSQHPGMAKEIYDREPVFRDALDLCAEIIKEQNGTDLISLLFPAEADREEMADKLKNTAIAQPAIFSIEYSLSQLWKHWGITPACMIGHSIGEFAAACIAGVLSVSDALHLICLRGELMADLPGGAMISVRASEDDIKPYLTDDINLAAVNGANSCVIAGPYDKAEEAEKKLSESGIEAKRLHTSHAFHSSMMEPIVEKFEKAVAELNLHAPEIPILSTVTREWMTDDQATDPHYWASHLRKPVHFHGAISQIWKKADHLLLEVGPGRTLATLAGQNPDRKNAQPSLASLPHPTKRECSWKHMRTALGTLWCHGMPIDWDRAESRTSRPPKIALPTYCFQRKRYTVEPEASPPAPQPNPVYPQNFPLPVPNETTQTMTQTAPKGIEPALKEILSELSGIEPEDMEANASFLEQGFDSLLLTQVGKEIQDSFKVKVSLRQLIDEFPSIATLTRHLEENSEVTFSQPEAPQALPQPQAMPMNLGQMPQHMPPFGFPAMPGADNQMPIAYIPVVLPWGAQQPMMPATPQAQPVPAPEPQQPEPEPTVKQAPSGPATVIDRSSDDSLTSQQKEHIDRLVFRYTEKTAKSKELTAKYRKFHADPRTASGFNRIWKEMVYQIITTKSRGSRLLDIDGNEYIDILNGFGPGFLGHSTDFLVDAVDRQLHRGYEVGPQCLLAMEAAELFCEVTGNERTSFVCTGSEAVQAAMRLARTVTKRDKIVIFARDYHGNFDEVLVRGVNRGSNLKTLPTAPGIPKTSAGNMIVLPYGTDESLEIIRNMADELAAVIVEPVQSRRPEFQPRSFIREVRDITSQSGALFVFDEVVTGFRFGPRGAQEFYGVEADLCTYGKVIGGGMSLGVVSGKAEYMDTFDGGMWQYGDDTFPEQPVTFFAGTFVRHPLAMASVKGMLEFFKTQPPHFWNQVNAKGDKLAGTVNHFFQENRFPIEMPNCGSLMFVRMDENQKYGNLFFYHLREKGIFMLEGFPSYMTAAHSDEDIDYAIAAFQESAFEMQAGGFFTESVKNENFSGPKLFHPPKVLAETDQSDSIETSTINSEKKFLAPLTVPTTEPQREVLVASRLNERSSCAFNESASLKFKGNVNVEALTKAFNKLVDRHDALRATFSEDGLTMTVAPQLVIPIEQIDLTGKDAETLDAILHVDASTPYDLQNGPLVRPMLAKLSEVEWNFIISAHHLVCDGWSYNVIAEELCELYNAECENRQHKLALPKQYADHSREMQAEADSEKHSKQREYWLEQFSTIPEPVELPLDRSYPAARTFQGATLEYRIGKQTYEAVKKAGAKQGSTLYSTLAAAFQLLIHRLTGQDDIVVCIPAAGQNDGKNTDQLIGHCVNFLPLRSRYDSSEDFGDFLKTSRKTLLEATDNRSYTYGELIQDLDLQRDPRRLPLLEVAFNVERMDYFGDWNDLEVVFEPNGKTHVHYTMFMNIVESCNGLRIDVDYNTDILDESTVLGWVKGFESLLEAIADNSSRKVSKLPIMDKEQLSLVLHEWNNHSNTGSFPEATVQALFEKQVKTSPDTTALVSDSGTISYEELDKHAVSIAATLQEAGVEPGDFVAVMAHRSPQIVAGLLGILKTGAAYVPIDPSYPDDRIEYMLKDAAPAVLLIDNEVEFSADKSVKSISLQEAFQSEAPRGFQSHEGSSDDVAYAIYTSGSTGTPKGTLIPHRGIVRLVKNTNYINFGSEETFLLSAPISFDASTLELWGPLLNGGKLALMPSGTPGLQDIGDAIEKYGVTTLWLTSGLFSLMVDEHPDSLQGLKQLLAGGDVLSPLHVEKALKLLDGNGSLINGYGPTENTTFTTCHTIEKSDLSQPSIPIGKPIAHTQCYILDEDMQPVPPGVKGRLYIGGDGLAIGYLNQPELTLKKFIPTPLSEFSDDRLYDSGDVCSWLKDGTIRFHGRADRQVKLRGFRIEPGEIENVLKDHPEVSSALVRVAGENAGDKRLIAYVTTNQTGFDDTEDIVNYLKESLPTYMVPASLMILPKFPVTPNGKIDHKALPEPTGNGSSETEKTTPPETDTEKKLAELWDEVLGCGSIGVTDNFFELGGHSLAGLKLFTRIQKEFGVNLPLATLFEAPTVLSLAKVIDTLSAEEKSRVQIVSRASKGSPGETPLFLIHGGSGGTLIYKDFIEQTEAYGEIYTIEAPMAVDRTLEKTESTIEATAELYLDYIREIYDGDTFAFGGYSFGGVLAYEIARQLYKSNAVVEKLFLFDTNNPANEEQFKNDIATWARTGWKNTKGDNFLEKVSNSRERLGRKIHERTELVKKKTEIKNQEKNNRKIEDDELRVTQINEMHQQMMNSYQPQTYLGETLLFRAESSRFTFDREMGWKDLIPNLTVHDIVGEHQEIFDSPNVEVLIRQFNEAMSLYG